MIEFLLVLGLGVLLYMSWQRVTALEQRTRQLEQQYEALWLRTDGNRGEGHVATAADHEDPLALAEPESAQPGFANPWSVRVRSTREHLLEDTEAQPVSTPAQADPEPVYPEETDVELPESATSAPSARRFDFEEIFGRQLPIWGGGIALAIAGFFMVRWAIDAGVLTRAVRVMLSFAFGALLIVAAELAHRFETRVQDERVRQALAGAGIATLYAAFYLAGNFYGLIDPAVAFVGMAMITALAIGLSFRFGVASAVLGLVGGFAAPALAGSTDPNLPMLATYLALVTGGLTVTGRRQQHPWLGIAALVGAFGWGMLLVFETGPMRYGAVIAVGGYLVVIGAMLPSLLGVGPLGVWGRLIAGGVATLQIAVLVDRSGYSPLAWATYLLLAGALAILGMRSARLREAVALGAALFLCLIAAWPDASGLWLIVIAAAGAIIFAGSALFYLRDRTAGVVDVVQLGLFSVALIAAICIQRGQPILDARAITFAVGASLLAGFPALGAWWESKTSGPSWTATILTASATATLLLAALLIVPAWTAPLVVAALALPLQALLRAPSFARKDVLHWGLAASAVILLMATAVPRELDMLWQGNHDTAQWRFAFRWAASAIPFAIAATIGGNVLVRRGAEALAALLLYGAIAMLLSGVLLPLALALAGVGLAWRARGREAALAAVLALGLLGAVLPLGAWISAGVLALAGWPFLLFDLPSLARVLGRIAPLLIAIGGSAALGSRLFARGSKVWIGLVAVLASVLGHTLYKQVFAIDTAARFVALGLAERTMWEALLALCGWGLALITASRWVLPAGTRFASVAALPVIVTLAHFCWFTLVLHNPL